METLWRRIWPGVLGLLGGALGALVVFLGRRGIWSDVTATWAAAIGNIVLAFVAVAVPWNERRLRKQADEDARFKAETMRSDDGHLVLRIWFTPPVLHESILVEAEVLTPHGSIIVTRARDRTGDVASERVTAALSPTQDQGRLVTSLYISRPNLPGPSKATVDLAITTSSGKILLKQRLDVSPLGETPEINRLFDRTI